MLENKCYVVMACRTGVEVVGDNTMHGFGHSSISDPTGHMAAQAELGETVISAKIDLEYLEECNRIGYLNDRRPEIYREMLDIRSLIMKQRELPGQFAGIYIVIILLCVAAALYRPSYFLTENVYMMLCQAAALGILSMGQLFVVTAGGTDLSVDATMKISMVIFMTFYNSLGEAGLLVGILVVLIAGLS